MRLHLLPHLLRMVDSQRLGETIGALRILHLERIESHPGELVHIDFKKQAKIPPGRRLNQPKP